jgi:hypothetical protein
MKTTTGGGNLVSVFNETQSIPDKNSLHHNYPNPFNPVTKINYDISKNATVDLVVYDITGKEIDRLVEHKIQSQGSYSISFDGSKYSSGIYFYKLEVTDINNNKFSDTKKMILIK